MAKLRMPPSVGDIGLGMRSRSSILEILYWNAAEVKSSVRRESEALRGAVDWRKINVGIMRRGHKNR